MLEIPCAQLPSVNVQYSDKTIDCSNNSGQWNLSGQKFLERSSFQRIQWKLLRGPGVTDKACEKFRQHFEQQLVDTGVCAQGEVTHLGQTAHLPDFCDVPMNERLNRALLDLHNTISSEDSTNARTDKTSDKTEESATSASKEPIKTTRIVVLLLKRKDQEMYSSFKYLADRIYGLQSICATESNFKPRDGFDPPKKEIESKEGTNDLVGFKTKADPKPRDENDSEGHVWPGQKAMQQYMANIAMKANMKAGGINHTATGVSDWLQNTLVVGADLTHPGSGAIENCPSISAVVSSVDETGGWFIGQQYLEWDQKSEIVTNLEKAMKGALDMWIHVNGVWPENVLYYRDGVGESQYDEIKTKENSAIRRAWITRTQLEEPGVTVPELKLTTVIVSKRHSTRFFPAEKKDAMYKNENCKPGLLVDSAVTDPYYSDFYLQSHKAIKGTARPCHYFVLNNEIGMTMNALEDLVSPPFSSLHTPSPDLL